MIWDFVFRLPTRIEFGQGKLNLVGHFIRELNGSKIMVITDQGLRKAGIVDKLLKVLQEEHFEFIVYDEVKPNPRDLDCETAYRLALEAGTDLLVGIGGGSSMDTAKAVGALLSHGGSISDWYGFNKLTKPITPLICIPTTSGTGSEITFFSVITDTKTKLKMNILDANVAPRIAILDPDLTVSLPAIVTASTGMDALTHAIEAYTCNISEPITDALALYAIDMINANLPIAVRDGTNVEARKNMLAASLIAGIAFGNSDVGGVHCMAEALGGLYDTPHGIANSMLLPYVFEFNIPSDVEKHAEAARRLGAGPGKSPMETALQGVELLKQMASDLGIPKMSQLSNVNPDDFPYLAEAATNNVSASSNPRPATKMIIFNYFTKHSLMNKEELYG